MPLLESLGWNAFFAERFAPFAADGLVPGRVAAENRTNWLLATERGEMSGEASGRLQFTAESPAELPKVGDWVALTFHHGGPGIIHAVLPRRTKVSRKEPGSGVGEQVIAANIDCLFIVQGLDRPVNPRRLERSLVMAHEGGASPVVVLNKADLCPYFEAAVAEAWTAAPGVTVIAASALTGMGMGELRACLGVGVTAAFVGPSGAGKSTLINALLGREAQRTAEVRLSDSRGRHITSRRELITLPGGGLLVDTPGMREIGLWNAKEGMDDAFPEIGDLAGCCRFMDCSHMTEPGCAILAALDAGTLARERYDSWLKLRKELAYLAAKQDGGRERERKRKQISKLSKEFYRVVKKR